MHFYSDIFLKCGAPWTKIITYKDFLYLLGWKFRCLLISLKDALQTWSLRDFEINWFGNLWTFFFLVSSFLKRNYTFEVQNIKYRLKNQKRREGREGLGKHPPYLEHSEMAWKAACQLEFHPCTSKIPGI